MVLMVIQLEGDTAKYLRNIGPFAEWEITVANEDNNELDRSQIDAIYLNFNGIGQNRD
jgi:hypothetical protein